ncbi:MAG: copper resistance protein B [Hyphomicrobium sp.]
MTMRNRVTVIAFMIAGLSYSPVWAQDPPAEDPHAGHSRTPSPTVPSNQGRDGGAEEAGGTTGEQSDAVMDTRAMQGGSPPPDARDPHAYSGGQDFGPFKLELADTRSFGSLLVDNLEVLRSGGNTSVPYDLQAWYGRTYDRAVLKAEGEIENGAIKEARSELLWGHAIAAFWDTQLGVRYDSGEGPNRSWLAFGVQGLAPYSFEVEATAYLGDSGRSALRLDASYELLITQKLILQPRIEANIYGKRDPDRRLGSGLSDVSAALRLRYEFRRELAPYIGIEWVRKYGETGDLARAAGEDANDTRFVAGLRFWF